MNRKFFALGLLIIFTFSAFAQTDKNERKELTGKVSALYQAGDLAEAAEAGEKLVKLEKDSADSTSYVNALINLARIKREYYVALRNKLAGSQLSAREKQAAAEKAEQNDEESETLFRQALEINEKSGNGQMAQTADIKRDLAWIITNHSGSGAKTLEKARGRIDEAEKLLLDSISINEQARGKDADETLLVALDAGDFYFKYVNFEKALPFYERFIDVYGQKHGAEDSNSVRALRPYAQILFATMQNRESSDVIKKIEALTKKSEPMPRGEIDLHLRSKDSVAYSAPIIIEQNERAEKYRAKMKAEGRTLNAGDISAMPRLINVPVKIEIDETGKITKALALSGNDQLRAEAESVVSKWTVRPFSYNGVPRKMRGILFYRRAQ